MEEGEAPEDPMLRPFEQLVREALATIPPEFHEQMENVLVRVQFEPGEEVMDRVGLKEGYTLLGFYEGIPLTAYGQARMPHPEIITIYERSIVEYCHGDRRSYSKAGTAYCSSRGCTSFWHRPRGNADMDSMKNGYMNFLQDFLAAVNKSNNPRGVFQ